MAIYIDNQNRIKDIFINVDGQKKRIVSMWADKNRIPTKVYQKKTGDIEVDPEEIAPINEINNWDYTLNDSACIVTLNYYANELYVPNRIITVYSNYNVNGKIYKTQIANYGENGTTNKNYMFSYIEDQDDSTIIFKEGIDTSNLTCTSYMFYHYGYGRTGKIVGLENLDTGNVTDMSNMFSYMDCQSIDVSGLNTSNVTDMGGMFASIKATSIIGLNNFDVSNVTNMSAMFSRCEYLTTLDLSSWRTSSKLYKMNDMFGFCKRLSSIKFSGFKMNTRSVVSFSRMFMNCDSLTTLDLTGWMTSSCDNNSDNSDEEYGEYNMFSYSPNLTAIYVTNGYWTLKNETHSMFIGCGTSNVTYK